MIIILLILIISIILIFLAFNDTDVFERKRKFGIYALYIPERFVHLNRELTNANIDANYVLGYDKHSLDMDIISENHDNCGKVACHMGHLSIMQRFLSTNEDYAIIFEDDIEFKDHNMIKSKLEYIINTLPSDSDITFLSYCYEECKNIDYNSIYSKANNPLCRHAYIVSRNGAKIILKETWPMNKNDGDKIYATLLKDKKMNGYLVNNKFIKIEQKREQFGSKLFNYISGKPPPKCYSVDKN